jgi:transposase
MARRLCTLVPRARLAARQPQRAGTFARQPEEAMDAVVVFLVAEGVQATNNFIVRIIDFGVPWHKRTQRTKRDKGHRWIERMLSRSQTAQLR